MTDRHIGEPESGYFKTKLVKGGPWVAARIHRTCQCTPVGGDDLIEGEREHEWSEACDRYPPLCGEIDGKNADPHRVWTLSNPIDEKEFRYLMEVRAWASVHAPADPMSKPTKAIDINTTPPVEP